VGSRLEVSGALPRGNVLGVNVTAVDLGAAVGLVMDAARNRRAMGVSALAVHGVMSAVESPELQYQLNQLEMVLPDGQPVRWALNWLHGIKLPDRVPGPDLMWEVCKAAASEGLGIFLYGSATETLQRIRANLERGMPGLTVAGVQASRFRRATEQERISDFETIRESGASVVFVGLGCPRQEIWTYENRLDLSLPVLAVGAAFDYHAGLLKRSPRWMGKAGLEWLYRLYQEPRRLAGRYLMLNPLFLGALLRQKLGFGSFSTGRGVPPDELTRPS